MTRVISYCVLIFCLEFVASFPYPEEYLEAYQSNNPGGGIPRQIQVSNLAHTQNGPPNPTYENYINRDANTVLQPARYNNIRYEPRPSFERPGYRNGYRNSQVEYPSNTNTVTPSAIQDMINRETIAQQRKNYENLIRSQQQIHEQLANQMRLQNLPQIQPQYPSREPLLNTVSEPYVSAVSTNNPYQQNIGNANVAPVEQYYHVQQQLPLINSPNQRPFAQNTAQSSQNAPIQIEVNHEVPTAPLNRQIQQSYNQWPNKQVPNVDSGYNMNYLFAKHPYIKDLLSTTTQRKRYMVIHPNGTVEHVDRLEPVAERHPNYLLVNAGSLPQHYGGHYQQPQAPPALPPTTFNQAPSAISPSPNSNYYANPYQQIAPTQTTQLTPQTNSIYTAPEAYPPQPAALPASMDPQAPAAPVASENSTYISATLVPAPQPTVSAPQPTVPVPQPTVPAPQPTVQAPASAPVEPEIITTPATLAEPNTAPTDPTKPTVPATSALGPKPAVPVTTDSTSSADLPKAAEPAIQVTPTEPGPKATPTASKTAALPITHEKPAVPASPGSISKFYVPETSTVPSKPVTFDPATADHSTASLIPSKLDSSTQTTTQAITSTHSAQAKNTKQSAPVTAAKKTAPVQAKSDSANTTSPDSPKTLTTPAKPDNVTTPTPTKPTPATSTTPDKPADSMIPTSPAKPADSTIPTSPSKPADSTAPIYPALPATSTTPAKPADSTTSTPSYKPTDSTTPTSPTEPATSTTPAKPASSETSVTPVKQTTPETNITPSKPKTTTPDKPAASKTPVKLNVPATNTASTKSDSAVTPTSVASPKKTSTLPQASTTPSSAIGKADSPSNKTTAIVKTSASSTETVAPNSDASLAEKLNPLGLDLSKSSSKPVMWFRTSDLDIMSKLSADDEFNVIYFIQVPPQPIIEKDTTKTVFPNGTIVEVITETIWDNEEDEEPRVTKTVTVLNQQQ